jgi:hypothetical protein
MGGRQECDTIVVCHWFDCLRWRFLFPPIKVQTKRIQLERSVQRLAIGWKAVGLEFKSQ